MILSFSDGKVGGNLSAGRAVVTTPAGVAIAVATTEGIATADGKNAFEIRSSQKKFWSFQPLQKPAVPKTRDAAWALTDIDREPWLARIHDVIVTFVERNTDAVIACSALRERYRAMLGADVPPIRWVFLDADRDLLSARLHARAGHFAGPEILEGQLRELEPPAEALMLPAELPVNALVTRIRTEFGLT